MTHLTERNLVELRDGLPVDAEVRLHLEECTACTDALREAQTRANAVERALGGLDEPFDVHAAKQRVQARLQTPRTDIKPVRARAWGGGWSLGKAAALLLVAAGAASALPGSPVRTWLSGGGEVQPATEATTATEAVDQTVEPVGGRLTVSGGPVSVVLDGVPAATTVEVRWVDGSAVTVRAAAGSSFSYGEGRVQATVVGGPISVELPRSAASVSMVVNGRMYLAGSADSVELPGPVQERTEARVTFTVPGG